MLENERFDTCLVGCGNVQNSYYTDYKDTKHGLEQHERVYHVLGEGGSNSFMNTLSMYESCNVFAAKYADIHASAIRRTFAPKKWDKFDFF
jgi:hypothetical protein